MGADDASRRTRATRRGAFGMARLGLDIFSVPALRPGAAHAVCCRLGECIQSFDGDYRPDVYSDRRAQEPVVHPSLVVFGFEHFCGGEWSGGRGVCDGFVVAGPGWLTLRGLAGCALY